MKREVELHSAESLGLDCDFRWNQDFVGLLASRLELKRCKWVLDVGCGRGQWTKTLLPWLASYPRLVGVDRESLYLNEFNRSVNLQLGVSGAKGVLGCVEQLPVSPDTFDLVTCQTLLMQVQSPDTVVKEMVRAARPGGLVLCVEPNHSVARLPISHLSRGCDPDEVLLLSELALRVAMGLKRRGKGEEYVGERLPELLHDAGLEDIKIWLSDKTFLDLPPYETAEEEARNAAVDNHWKNGSGAFNEADARESFLAADGSAAQFGRCWEVFKAAWQGVKAQREHGKWRSAGGGSLYIAAGRKPLSSK